MTTSDASPKPAPPGALDAIALVVLVALAGLALVTFRDYGLGWDDYTHAQYGELLLAFYGSGLTDTRALSFVNLYMYGGGFDMAAALAAKLLPFSIFETRRLVGALVGIVGIGVAWRLGRRLGGPLAGLFALLLLAACPFFYGHMFINPKDGPFAVWVAIFLLGAVRAVQQYPRPDATAVILVGLGFGLTVGSRVVGASVALFPAAALAFIIATEAGALGPMPTLRRAGRFLATLLPAALLAYAVVALIWPWGAAHPLNPIKALGYFSHFFEKPWKEMFGGSIMLVPDMPRAYVPTLFALKLPELTIALGLAGIAAAFACLWDSRTDVRRRAVPVMLAIAVVLPVAVAVVTRPAMYNGIRHFVFVAPPLAVLGGWIAARIAERLRRSGAAPRALFSLVMTVGLAVPAIDMIRLHPYQYTHFNRWAGGIRGADERYMLDYWGLAFKQAGRDLRALLTQRLETPPTSRGWRIAVCGPHPPAAVALGPEFQLTWDAKGADFALMLGEFYCADLKTPVLVEIAREGVVYARVHDLRGRSVPSLFTIPPP